MPHIIEGLASVLTRAGFVAASAGAPGFVAPDALAVARLLYPWMPDLAAWTVAYAATHQGHKVDDAWDEEPGKLPQTVLPAATCGPTYLGLSVLNDPIVYWGGPDATAEWLITTAIAWRQKGVSVWHLDEAWHAAGDYLLRRLAVGGGLLRWGPRSHPGTGLDVQCRRDEWLHFENGAQAPFADWATQASALVALRGLADLTGDPDYNNAAAAMQRRIENAFEVDSLGLDRDDRPIRGASSAPGALLWAGALSGEAADRAANRLVQPDLLTRFGLRNVADTAPEYNPLARCGRIVPYDSYLAACGLRAVGREREADRIVNGMAAAIDALRNWPESWAVMPDGELRPIGGAGSASTMAVRHAIGKRHWHTADGLCERIGRS